MFRHVVMFRWQTAVTREAIAHLETGLGDLPGAIDTVRAYHFGPDVGLNDANWDFVVVADFDDRDGYLTYRDHDAHQRLITERVAPIVAERAAVQFEADRP